MSKEEKKEEDMSNDELLSIIIASIGFILFCVSFVWIVSNLDFILFDNGEFDFVWGHHFSFLSWEVFLPLLYLFGATWLLITETLYWTSKDSADDQETIYDKTFKVKTTAVSWGFLANMGIWGYVLIFMVSIEKYNVGGTIEGIKQVALITCGIILLAVLIYVYIYINSLKFRRQLKQK